jgi:hypothetical protein
MKLHLVVLLASVLGCLGAWCQATSTTSSVESQASTNTVNKSPTTAATIAAAHNSTDWVDLERAFISKTFQSTQPVDCKSGTYSCGTGCCTSDQQCCMNKDTSGHYCAKRCE